MATTPNNARRTVSPSKCSTLTQAAIMQAHQRLPVRRAGRVPSWREADVRCGKIDACLTFERVLDAACDDGNPVDDVLALLTPLEMRVRARCELRDRDAGAPSPGEVATHLDEEAANAELNALQHMIRADRSPGTVARFLDACRKQIACTMRLALHYCADAFAHRMRA